MQRHMQNISFLVIVGVFLSCGFFFSEQVRVGEDPSSATVTAIPTAESREDLPVCSGDSQSDNISECYHEAAAISGRLVEAFTHQILSLEPESGSRVAFVEMQQTWEKSRDADCQFVQDRAPSEGQGEIDRDMCLVDHNLARLDRFEDYFCDYYGDASCEASAQSHP